MSKKLIYEANESNYDYSKTAYERDGWGGGEYTSNDNIRQNTIMHSGRIYVDENNIMRYMLNDGVKDFENDFYCVAMSEGFEAKAAEICGYENNQLHSGYTFYVEFIDSNGKKHSMNVLKVDSKGGDDNEFTSHDNLIEFITAFDSNAEDNSFGVVGPASDSNKDKKEYSNLDYDKLFNAEDVRISSVYAYENGWMISGNYADGYTINTEIDGIPITSDGITMTPEDYKKETIKQSIIKSVIDCDMPDDIKEAMICRRINEVCDEIITKEEYERLLGIYESNKLVESEKTINSLVTYAKANVTTASVTRYDPLILDLDGDGFNIEAKKNGTNFDLDKNGFAEKINWTSRDGFLCLDLNGNGTIDNGGELFGDQTLLADGTAAKNGFEALAQYDGNGDGVIDENDEIFSSLNVWTSFRRLPDSPTQWTS